MESVLSEVKKERERQYNKWGVQNRNSVEWIAILAEEVGEASKEAVDFYFGNGVTNPGEDPGDDVQAERLRNFRKELIQVAAVAVQAVENIDRDAKTTAK